MTRVEHVEVLVEEPSAEAALQVLLPRLLGDVTFAIHATTGKSKLLQDLPSRLRGYASWIPRSYRVLVVVDRDDDDCAKLKAQLEGMAAQAGLTTRATSRSGSFQVVNRIAVEELEAWFFGDWEAVRAAYSGLSASLPSNKHYRDPDAIRGGTWEALERALQQANHFKGGYRKIEAARAIAGHMDPARNTSASFCALRDVLKEMVR